MIEYPRELSHARIGGWLSILCDDVSRLDGQLFQVLHEDLQADVVSEEEVGALARRRVVRDRRVQLRKKESRLQGR